MKCEFCKQEFEKKESDARFCGKSCAAKFNNPKRNRIKKAKPCESCKEPVPQKYLKYCSIECHKEGRKKELLRKLNEGIRVDVKTLRRYLKQTRLHQCEICKGTEWMGKPMPLIMDHINGNPADDSIENLRFICPNCDRFLPTFGSRNKGNGRKSKGLKRGSQL